MELRRVVTAAAVTAILAACGSSTEGAAPKASGPGTPLFDGISVVDGSQLVGPIFTEPAQASDGERSIAIISIDSDPVRVYDVYAALARRAGFPVAASGMRDSIGQPTCGFVFPGRGRTAFDEPEPRPIPNAGSSAASPSGVPSGPATTAGTVAPVEVRTPTDASTISCSGAGRRTDKSEMVTIEVSWGSIPDWSPPTHHALIQAGTQPLLFNQVVGDAQVPTPTQLPSVSDASLETRPGEVFGTKNNAFESGYRRFVLVPGSRVVAELPDRTLLSVDDDIHDVMRAYARQLSETGGAPVEESTTRRGNVLTVDFGPIGGGGAHLLSDPSGRWLLIQVSSD